MTYECPSSIKDHFIGLSEVEWIIDAALMTLHKSVLYAQEKLQKERDDDGGVLRKYQTEADFVTTEIMHGIKTFDPEVLLRNIAVRRPVKVRRICKEIADLMSNARKTNQISSTNHDLEKQLSLQAHLGFCEVYERTSIIKETLQKSHCLAAPRFITQKDIHTLTLMLLSFKTEVSDAFLTCTDTEAFLALRVVSNWFASYMHPFSLREIPTLCDDMVCELIKAINHIFKSVFDTSKDNEGHYRFLRESLVLLEDLVTLKGMPILVLENVDFALLVRIAYQSNTQREREVSSMAWSVLGRCSEYAGTASGSEKLSKLYFTPEYKLIPSAVSCVRKTLSDVISSSLPLSTDLQIRKDVMLACGTILANLSQGGPVCCQDLLQCRSLTDFIPEYLSMLTTCKYTLSHPELLHCGSVLAGNLLVWYDTVSLGVVVLRSLTGLALLIIENEKSTDYWKILEAILSSISLSFDHKYLNVNREKIAAGLMRDFTDGVLGKSSSYRLVSELATSSRLSVKPPSIAIISMTKTVLPREIISVLVSNLPQMWSVCIHQKNCERTSLPLICSLIYTIVPVMDQIDLFQCLPSLLPVLLDYLSLKSEQPIPIQTEPGSNAVQLILKSISAFTKTSDIYTLVFIWKCCGKASGLTLSDILRNTDCPPPKGRLTYKNIHGLQILADMATHLPSVCKEISRNWKDEILEGVMNVAGNQEWEKDDNAGLVLKVNAIRLLSALAIFDKDAGLRISENPDLITHITNIVSDYSTADDNPLSLLGASLLANVLSQQTGGSEGIHNSDFNSIQRVFEAHEADSAASDRFDKEFGAMFRGRNTKKTSIRNSTSQDQIVHEGDRWKECRAQHGDFITMVPSHACAFCSKEKVTADDTFINCDNCNTVIYCSSSCRTYHLSSVTGNSHSSVCENLKATNSHSVKFRRLQVAELSGVIIILYYFVIDIFWSALTMEATKMKIA